MSWSTTLIVFYYISLFSKFFEQKEKKSYYLIACGNWSFVFGVTRNLACCIWSFFLVINGLLNWLFDVVVSHICQNYDISVWILWLCQSSNKYVLPNGYVGWFFILLLVLIFLVMVCRLWRFLPPKLASTDMLSVTLLVLTSSLPRSLRILSPLPTIVMYELSQNLFGW